MIRLYLNVQWVNWDVMMTLSDRHQNIVELVKRRGKISVEELVSEFGVTAQSIRADLRVLAEKNQVVRFHGGVQLPDTKRNVEYEARRSMAADEKAAIGRGTAQLVPNKASLFINIGTTTEAVARALEGHEGLLVVTNNINVADSLRFCAAIDVVIAGGKVRQTDGGIVGEEAVDFISQFKVDLAIIGVSAIDPDGTLLDYDIREVRVAQAILENARRTILVADSTKLSRTAPVRLGTLSHIDVMVTDRIEDDEFRALCERCGVELIEVYA